MNPQDPLNPNQSSPVPEQLYQPAPPNQSADEPVQPAVSPETQPAAQAPYNPSSLPATPPSNMMKRILLIIVGLVVLVALGIGGLFAYNYFNGIPLVTYSTKEYSVSVPKDYKKSGANDAVEFTENAKDEATRSSVLVGYQPYLSKVNDEYKKAFLDSIEKDFKSGAELSFINVDKVKDFKVSRTKIDGFDAIKGEGKSLDFDGKENGRISGTIVIGNTGAYQVYVFAHTSDPDLAKRIDQIIGSLDIK